MRGAVVADNSAPGWYPDYAGSGNLRYWNGKRWTNAMQPPPGHAPAQQAGPGAAAGSGPAGPPQPTPHGQPPVGWHGSSAADQASKKPWFKRKRVLIPAGVLASMLVIGQLGQSPKDATAQADAATTSSSSSTPAAAPAAAASTSAAPAKAATTAAKPAPVAAAPAAPKEPGVGSTVHEGDIQFTLKSWKCGAKSVGGRYVNERAQGMYCIAGFTYKNVGNDPKTFDSSALTARVGDAKYKSNFSANYALNADNNTFLEQVNPGNAITGKIAFDVPQGTHIDHLYILDGFTGEGTGLKVG